MNSRINGKEFNLSLGNTPLNKCILAARDVIKDFKKRNMVEIVHTVFLTDGKDTESLEMQSRHISYRGVSSNPTSKVILQDEKTHTEFELDMTGLMDEEGSAKLFEFIRRSIPNINIIGFFITNLEIMSNNEYMIKDATLIKNPDMNSILGQYRKNGFLEFDNCSGYDKFFLVDNKNLHLVEQNIKNNNSTDYNNVLNSFFEQNKRNRVMLTQFVNMIVAQS